MARYLMFQGTGSGVGKSLVTAGFCRIFARKGIRVAPFKAQNMSLNSGVTPLGEEIGRAQMLQARAAMVDPDSRMNPILLKPQGDCQSQVIIRGKVWKTYEAYEYYQYKKFLWEKIIESLNSLAEEYDLICIEGAGSPAEINLREQDLVNMSVARYARIPVFLIGDIEKGGVFAQLYGTWALLTKEERELLCGFIINKFRGNYTILEPGLKEIEKLTQIPVLGVIPYSRFQLDDEDSMTVKIESTQKSFKTSDIKIGIIRFPHIANFTDFEPLDHEPDVETRYIFPDETLNKFDMIILPGSKNTIRDLQWLKQFCFQERLEQFIYHGGVVLGVCGGYQMLGESLIDLDGNEDYQGEMEGLAIIPMKTIFEKEKTLRIMQGFVKKAEQVPVKGYEIHQGKSSFFQAYEPLFTFFLGNKIEPEGVVINDQVFGTYLHGLFDDGSFRRYFINQLRKRKGLKAISTISLSWQEIIEKELNRLADLLETYIDVKRVENLIENH
ncbi:MAG: cobyric acid synthase [Candidatus Atribacteria bacterium]|nr:cobyric acid synthase [Candidatus Atribacteria bacterium]